MDESSFPSVPLVIPPRPAIIPELSSSSAVATSPTVSILSSHPRYSPTHRTSLSSISSADGDGEATGSSGRVMTKVGSGMSYDGEMEKVERRPIIESKGKRRESYSYDAGLVTPTHLNHNQMEIMSSLYHATPTQSSFNSSSFNPSAPGSSSTPLPAPQQSLEELLQGVDLSAALLLVNSLKSQQSQLKRSPSSAFPPPSVEVTPTLSRSTSPPPLRKLNTRMRSNSKAIPVELTSYATESTLHESIGTPSSSVSATSMHPLIPGDIRRPRVNSIMGLRDKDKRRSLSLSFGAGRRERSDSAASTRSKEAKVDQRAILTEGGREFEEQISKVHLTLSPATLRRAHNAERYLSLLYVPLYEALESNSPPPNLLSVSRWREEREEIDRRWRRTRVGMASKSKAMSIGEADEAGDGSRLYRSNSKATTMTNGSGRPPSIDSIRSPISARLSPNTSAAVPVYGARRNKHPKVWEIYPDDVVEFVESDGVNATEALEAQERSIKASESRLPMGSASRVGQIGSTTSLQSSIAVESPRLPTIASTPDIVTAGQPDSRRSSIDTSLRAQSITNSSTNDFHYSPSRTGSLNSGRLSRSIGSQRGLPKSSSVISNSEQQHTSSPLPPQLEKLSRASISLDYLPETTIATSPVSRPSSQKAKSITTTANIASPQRSLGAKPTPSEGLRHSLSRRIDRIRGKGSIDLDGESFLPRSTNPSTFDLTKSTVGEESDQEASSGVARSAIGLASAFKETSSMVKRATLRVQRGGGGGQEDSAFKLARSDRSSGEEGPGRRKRVRNAIWATVRSGFRGPLEPLNVKNSDLIDIEALRRRRMMLAAEESEEDEEPREVLDLADEDFVRLNDVLRQLRVKLNQVDTFLPHIPPMLNRYLDEIGHHDRQTLSESGLTVAYSHPRLPASIVAELSNTQLGKSVPLFTDSLFFTATESSTTGTSSDLSESDTESSDAEGERLDQVDPSTLLPARSYRPKRRATILAPTVRQVRRVTDPTNRPPPLRPRSHTISTPANRSTHPPSTDYPPAASPLPSRVDPLVGLKKVITELETATIQVDREAKKILASQESVADEIAAVVTEVNEIQIGIDQIDFQQLRGLEDHYLRLRASLSRPSSTLDLFWAGLSYVLLVLFWLSWFLVTVFRIVRSIILLPISFLRWMMFL